MQKDLVCGMEVDEEKRKFRATYAGVTYYFCSSECLATFERLARVFSKDALDSITPIRQMDP